MVQYATSDDANEAVKSLNGSDLKGRALKLEIAAKKGDKKVGWLCDSDCRRACL